MPPRSLALAGHLPPQRRRHLRLWLLSGAVLTFVILVVGGITRLTESGLSIVDWEPLIGVIPPLNEAAWEAAFAQYQRYPEYRLLRPDMTLAEYRFIYLWEYAHRLLARFIGLVFIVPFLVFWARGYLRAPLARRLLLILALGAAQGLMGWLMVASGLVDVPNVAHERLAAHLILAFAVFGACLWTAAGFLPAPKSRPRLDTAADARGLAALRRALLWFGAVLVLQVVYGAFTAGLDAGRAFNTYPLMAGGLLPPEAWRLEPPLRNLVDNIAVVQWIHRTLPVVLLGLAIWMVVLGRRVDATGDRAPADSHGRWGVSLLAVVVVQIGLGIATLLLFVPISLAVVHQAVALALFGTVLLWLHRVVAENVGGGPAPAQPLPASRRD